MSARPGMTLMELLISMGFFLMFFILCSSLFLSSWRGYNIISTTQDVERNAFLAVERFSRDMAETGLSSICNQTRDGAESYIYFPSKREVNGDFPDTNIDSPYVWKNWILYYLFPDPKGISANGHTLSYLMRKVIPGGDQPDITTVRGMILSMNGAQAVARDIYSFVAEPQTMGEVNNWFLTIETQDAQRGEKCSLRLEKVIIVNCP